MTRAEELLNYGSYFDQAEVVASFLEDEGWPTYGSIVRRLGRAADRTSKLLDALTTSRDLLLERVQGSPARSAAHNARIVIETAISEAEQVSA